MMKLARAWVLLPSGQRLNLLAPDPEAWTDRDLAIGLSRTYRWAGYSAWDHPLSVAQHSLTVLALRRRSAGRHLTPAEARRELLHDATEALLGGYDPITPLKLHLGDGYRNLVALHQRAVDERYALPAWDEDAYRAHKLADYLAAASEALHCVGWSREAIRNDLEIDTTPLEADPLFPMAAFRPWEPWPANYAADRFLETLRQLTPDGATAIEPTPEPEHS
jgi:5'-deoxynucleotidase YfbR-like HD superfamily hydrolase